jgi:hypothetical protein
MLLVSINLKQIFSGYLTTSQYFNSIRDVKPNKPSKTMQAKLIRRNATRQQAAIFAQIKSAKYVVTHGWQSQETILENLSLLPRIYAENGLAMLCQISEFEYEIAIDANERYILSTQKEAIAPVATEETTQATEEIKEAIASAASTSAEEPATLKDLEAELYFTELELKDCEEKIDSTKGFVKMLKKCEGKMDNTEGKMLQLSARLQHLQTEAETLDKEATEIKRKIAAMKIASTPVEEPTQAIEEVSLDSPIASTATSLDSQLAATEEEYNQAWEKVRKLEFEAEEIKALYQSKINIALEKTRKISGRLNGLLKEQAIARPQPKLKIDIVSIELTRIEGCDDDRPNHIVTSIWLEANKTIQQWAKTAPKEGYQECTAKLVFSDGNSITTPIKLDCWSFDVLKSITDELDPQNEIKWHKITHDDFANYLAAHKLNTKNLALA